MNFRQTHKYRAGMYPSWSMSWRRERTFGLIFLAHYFKFHFMKICCCCTYFFWRRSFQQGILIKNAPIGDKTVMILTEILITCRNMVNTIEHNKLVRTKCVMFSWGWNPSVMKNMGAFSRGVSDVICRETVQKTLFWQLVTKNFSVFAPCWHKIKSLSLFKIFSALNEQLFFFCLNGNGSNLFPDF